MISLYFRSNCVIKLNTVLPSYELFGLWSQWEQLVLFSPTSFPRDHSLSALLNI